MIWGRLYYDDFSFSQLVYARHTRIRTHTRSHARSHGCRSMTLVEDEEMVNYIAERTLEFQAHAHSCMHVYACAHATG